MLLFLFFIVFIVDISPLGELSALEINELLEIICGHDVKSRKSLQHELKRLDMNHDGSLSFNEFVAIVNQNPLLLYPAYEMRDILRTLTLGNRRWACLARDRTSKHGDKCITIILTTLTNNSQYQNQKVSFNHHNMVGRSAKAMDNFVQRSNKKEKSYRQQMLHDRSKPTRRSSHSHQRRVSHKQADS